MFKIQNKIIKIPSMMQKMVFLLCWCEDAIFL